MQVVDHIALQEKLQGRCYLLHIKASQPGFLLLDAEMVLPGGGGGACQTSAMSRSAGMSLDLRRNGFTLLVVPVNLCQHGSGYG